MTFGSALRVGLLFCYPGNPRPLLGHALCRRRDGDHQQDQTAVTGPRVDQVSTQTQQPMTIGATSASRPAPKAGPAGHGHASRFRQQRTPRTNPGVSVCPPRPRTAPLRPDSDGSRSPRRPTDDVPAGALGLSGPAPACPSGAHEVAVSVRK